MMANDQQAGLQSVLRGGRGGVAFGVAAFGGTALEDKVKVCSYPAMWGRAGVAVYGGKYTCTPPPPPPP